MPDDAALPTAHPLLRRPDAEVLVVAADLLGARVEDYEVVDYLQQTRRGAELHQGLVQEARLVALFPPQEVVLLRVSMVA